jgi:hypothetical protein
MTASGDGAVSRIRNVNVVGNVCSQTSIDASEGGVIRGVYLVFVVDSVNTRSPMRGQVRYFPSHCCNTTTKNEYY